ncbi:MAG: hypothetical protein H0W47_17355 [Polaromonas sp.]|uniref:hypothetical protein n=1 Tax=Polaromonas sp. TaxID=1869339 RepID=UPI00181E8977|nr:hypothetical protein [Polaromonas sp.]MBA3595535.1 hypothetical protein [Polaromonas sp.]
MRSTHNTIRALAIGLALTLLVVTGTAAMMAAFSSSPPTTDIYRRAAVTPEPASLMATGHDSVLYERVVLADGRVQWVLTDEPATALSTLAKNAGAPVTAATTTRSQLYASAANTVSYTLVVKPAGLSKPVTNCARSANSAYDIACKTMI